MPRVFVPFNTPSSKNSKVKTKHGIFHSKTVRKYLQNLGIKKYSVSKRTVEGYKTRPNLFEEAVSPMREYLKDKPLPHTVGFYFQRGTKHKFDWINLSQIICDLLVAHRVIPDDNMDCLIPSPFTMDWGAVYGYDKDNPGCILIY